MPGDSLEELWKRLSTGDTHSLLKKHLTPTVYNKLKNVTTNFGGTLADCIRSGEILFCIGF